MAKIIIIFLMIVLKGYSLQFNHALKKIARMSSNGKECSARYATDGNLDRSSIACAHESDKRPWLTVNLGRKYKIDYIVTILRTDCKHCPALGTAEVGLYDSDKTKNKSILYLCKESNSSKESVNRIKELHYRCDHLTKYYQKAAVLQKVDILGLAVHEFQAFGQYIENIGCFEEIKGSVNMGERNNPIECLLECEAINLPYAGLKNDDCLCGDGIKGSQAYDKCTFICKNGVDLCGGQTAYSVFNVFPYNRRTLKITKEHFLGCFYDSFYERDFLHFYEKPGSMSVDLCREYCAEKFFPIFALQAGTKCYCDTNYGYQGVTSEYFCDEECEGNKAQQCGGYSLSSVFFVLIGSGGMDIVPIIHHCADGFSPNSEGICVCRAGWNNLRCSLRICETSNGDCKGHKCRSLKVFGRNYAECICKQGFDKMSWWENCEDIDECEDPALCNVEGANCVNTMGSYNCTCKEDGMIFNVSRGTCEDVDECAGHPAPCNFEVAECFNTIGSYSCNCFEKGMVHNSTTKICEDADECAGHPALCNFKISKCFNTIGSYSCNCFKKGMVYNSTTKICNDVDECAGHPAPCNFEVTECFNAIGSYSCNCFEKGTAYNSTTKTCEDVDECAGHPAPCNFEVTECFNTIGSYSCNCFKKGMVYNSTTKICEDVDECDSFQPPCDLKKTICSNTIGSYTCTCLEEGMFYNKSTKTCEVSLMKVRLEATLNVSKWILISILAILLILIVMSLLLRNETNRTESTITTITRSE